MVELLHTADTHLGYRQYNLPDRKTDFHEAFSQVVDAAIDADVDAIVHAGDLFDDSRPGADALSDAFQELKRLDDADIPFLTIVGNHDATRDQQWVEVFETLELANRLTQSGTQIGNTTFYGLDHVERGKREQLDYQYQEPETENAVLVAHGLFTPIPNADWHTEIILNQSNIAFDAVLAGDDHMRHVETVGDTETVLTYPGSTERTAADQRETRGYQFVSVTSDGVDIDWQSLDTRDFVYVDVELGGGDGVDVVRDAVQRQATEFAESIVIVTVTGDGDRVPKAQIEELGYEHDALKVQVNDRREFTEDDRDYRDVDFADPTDAVEERREEVPLGPVATDLEEIARDVDSIADSNVADTVEQEVDDLIDDKPLEAFRVPESDSGNTPSEDTPGTPSDDSTDPNPDSGGDSDSAEADTGSDDTAEEETNESPTSTTDSQLTLEDL